MIEPWRTFSQGNRNYPNVLTPVSVNAALLSLLFMLPSPLVTVAELFLPAEICMRPIQMGCEQQQGAISICAMTLQHFIVPSDEQLWPPFFEASGLL